MSNDQTKTPGAMVLVSREKLEFFANDLALHGVGDIETAKCIDTLLSEQPPAVGGEPDVIGYFYKGDHMGDQFNKQCLKHYYRKSGADEHEYIQPVALIARAHVAPLLAEIERHKFQSHCHLQRANLAEARIAELEAAQGEAVAWMLDGSVGGNSLEFQITELLDLQNRHGGILTPLYRQAQPATAKVVLPERLNDSDLEELEVIEVLLHGHGLRNLAGTMAAARQFIDEVAELNGGA